LHPRWRLCRSLSSYLNHLATRTEPKSQKECRFFQKKCGSVQLQCHVVSKLEVSESRLLKMRFNVTFLITIVQHSNFYDYK
jgi:hypothetical protein